MAVITGGGGAIGGAIAQAFAREGASVAVADVLAERARAAAATISQAGGKALAITADVALADDCARLVEETVRHFGKLTTLVNTAAAVTPNAPVESLPLAAWTEALTVNLTACFLTAQFAIPHIRAAGGGTIVNIASQLGQTGVPKRAAYSTTKAALIQFSKCLAVECGPDNIRVNTISPGTIATPRSISTYGSAQEQQRVRGPAHVLGRTGRAEEIAEGAVFLASERSSFMTGADLLLDGGYIAFKGEMPRRQG